MEMRNGKGEALRPSWEEILFGAERRLALDIVTEIADSLLKPPESWIPSGRAETYRWRRGISLATGSAGLTLFFAYLNDCRAPGTSCREIVRRYTEHLADGLERVSLTMGFAEGNTGVLWAADHSCRKVDLEFPGLKATMEELDSSLIEESVASAGPDLWGGRVGHGVFALDRSEHRPTRLLLKSIVKDLESNQRESGAAATWPRERIQPSPVAGRRYPRSITFPGVAHGLAGIVSFLSLAGAAGIEVSTTREVCESAWMWLKQRDNDEKGLPIAAWGNERSSICDREGWRNGRLGVVAALMNSGRKLEHEDMYRWALTRARCLDESLREHIEITECGLSNGLVGFGHLFNRMYQISGDDQLADAARFWFLRLMSRHNKGHGVGGFTTQGFTQEGDSCELHNPGFLYGSAGIGLGLLGAIASEAAAWDRALLLS